MRKKGQVTIFIIAAVIIIGMVALFFTIRGTFQKEAYTPDVSAIKNFIDECVEDVGKEGIFVVSIQGGFLNPEPNIQILGFKIGYLYYEGENRLPNLGDIEKDISKYVSLNLEACVNEFESFKKTGFNINQGNIETNTIIREDFVDINIRFPLSIEKDNSTSILSEEYKRTYPIKLKKYYDVAKAIVEMEMKDPSKIDAIYLLNLDINIDFTNYENQVIVYALEDKESKINNKPYLFVFANKLK